MNTATRSQSPAITVTVVRDFYATVKAVTITTPAGATAIPEAKVSWAGSYLGLNMRGV